MIPEIAPGGSGNRYRYSREEYIRYGMWGVFAFVLIVLYAFEMKWFGLYLNVKALVLGSLAAGALLGALVGVQYSTRGYDLTERVQIIVFFTVMCMVFGPLVGSLSNRLLSSEGEQTHVLIDSAWIKDAEPFGKIKGNEATRRLVRIFFDYEGKGHEITYEMAESALPKSGERMGIRVRNGLWGARYIDRDAIVLNSAN